MFQICCLFCLNCVWKHTYTHTHTHTYTHQRVQAWSHSNVTLNIWKPAGKFRSLMLKGNMSQRTDIGKYSFVNRTIKLWNQLPAEALATFHCTSHIFRKRVRKAIISHEKWRVFWSVVTKRPKVQGREKWGVKCSELQWSEVLIFDKCVYCYWFLVM